MTIQPSPLRIAQVGYGYWGPNLARNLYQMPDVELAYLVDRDPQVLANVAGLFPGTTLAADAEQVLADETVDAVVIATPAKTHFDLAHKALSVGKHVFVEKPLAMQLDEARTLVDLAAQRGRVLMVGHVFEYNSAVRYIKTALDQGELGDVY